MHETSIWARSSLFLCVFCCLETDGGKFLHVFYFKSNWRGGTYRCSWLKTISNQQEWWGWFYLLSLVAVVGAVVLLLVRQASQSECGCYTICMMLFLAPKPCLASVFRILKERRWTLEMHFICSFGYLNSKLSRLCPQKLHPPCESCSVWTWLLSFSTWLHRAASWIEIKRHGFNMF